MLWETAGSLDIATVVFVAASFCWIERILKITAKMSGYMPIPPSLSNEKKRERNYTEVGFVSPLLCVQHVLAQDIPTWLVPVLL